MRVTPMNRTLHRLHRDESGAVLMVVAVTLLVLIGMLVLTVDLGRAVAIKREMVSGTDAAAIAAATECALGHSSSQASAAASAILAQNKSGATLNGPISAPGCGLTPTAPQIVTVNTTVHMDYFFAGIFGFNSGDVGGHAVAEWGVVAGGLGVPVTVDLQQLLDCGITPDPPSPAEVDDCELEYPKDTLQEPRWGVLDLSKWGDRNAAPCSVPASTSIDLIDNGGAFDPMPAPAYDCIDNGLSDAVWESLEGQLLLFPVLDLDLSEGTVKPNSGALGGTDCTGAQIDSLRAQGYDCQIDTAYIVGWIQLFVSDVSKHGPDITVTVDYRGITTGGGIPGDDTFDFGARAVRLVN
jgi:putative Flp pilus-assembly TadE/G-like protein